jgi:hypothetical protein
MFLSVFTEPDQSLATPYLIVSLKSPLKLFSHLLLDIPIFLQASVLNPL